MNCLYPAQHASKAQDHSTNLTAADIVRVLHGNQVGNRLVHVGASDPGLQLLKVECPIRLVGEG